MFISTEKVKYTSLEQFYIDYQLYRFVCVSKLNSYIVVGVVFRYQYQQFEIGDFEGMRNEIHEPDLIHVLI